MKVLWDIEQEIRQYGEPANPGLWHTLLNVYRALTIGGAVVGFRGMGKSLLANLSALANAVLGKAVVVVDVGKVLTLSKGGVELGEISNCHTLNEALGYNALMNWVLERVNGRGVAKVECDKPVIVEGEGLLRLKALAKQLRGLHIMPIFDGFEDVVLRPEKYGYAVPRLMEDFFDLVDTPLAPFGLALPVELWTHLDLQIKSRIAPVYVIRWEVEDMRQFLRRLCQCDPGPLGRLELRNPTAVVNLAEELRRRSPEEVFARRLEDLRHIAQEVVPHDADALFEVLKELWMRQNIYTDIPRPRKRAKFLVRGLSGYGLSTNIIELIRAYVYKCDDCHHLVYELLL